MQSGLPETLQQAIVYFSDKDRALEFLVRFRWPNGNPTCPWCDSQENSFVSTRSIWKCKGCKKQFSAKAGTIMEDSPIGLDKWLPAIWMLCGCKNGISSYELHRDLGVSQRTAWFMLHRIREAMQDKSSNKFAGQIEIDETLSAGRRAICTRRAALVLLPGLAAMTRSL
jgi:transposase-like protein